MCKGRPHSLLHLFAFRSIHTNPTNQHVPSIGFTGKHPTLCPGFNPRTQVLHSLPQLSLVTTSRQALQDYFDNTCVDTDRDSSLEHQEGFRYYTSYSHYITFASSVLIKGCLPKEPVPQSKTVNFVFKILNYNDNYFMIF